MTRPQYSTPLGRYLLPGTVAGLVVLALLPLGWIRWLSGLGNFARVLVAPISQPLVMLAGVIQHPPPNAEADPEAYRQLVEQVAHWRLLYQVQAHENDGLRRQIEELQRGVALDPTGAVRILTAAVTGTPSDPASKDLTVRAGKRKGVDDSAVAMTRGTQLVGRVIAVREQLCTVRPITRADSGLRVRVLLDEEQRVGLTALLMPTGSGTLSGRVEERRITPADAPLEPAVGNPVRLFDETWPRSAQGLIVGVVERVETDPSTGLRKVITVRPTLNIENVAEVMLRLTGDAEPGAGGVSEGGTP